MAAVWLAFLSYGGLRAEEPSRKEPAIYRQQISSLLTPADKILKGAATATEAEAGEDGVVLLDEEIHYFDDKGRRYLVNHQMFKANNDSGVKEIAEEIHRYRKANQKIHLVLARTISAEGKSSPLRPNAALLQSPQRQADYALYDDQAELRLIYPNVKPGSVTESIVVTEESQFRIPGEFTAVWPWAYGWPVREMRRVVDAPVALANRLKTTMLGSGVPEPERQQISEKRVRLTWKSGPIVPAPVETNRPPASQSGPAVWLTTLPDWDSFVSWYAPLLGRHSTLKPELAKSVEEWTRPAGNPAEVLDILFSKVAVNVRYTGLEFGTSDLEPHDCTQVWENQYGDCKDKANLLRAMLLHKGIPAYLVLLNTDDAGRIEKRSPDFRQFDHAIVVAEPAPGQMVFCDPTISRARPGVLAPSSADRDVLLIKNKTAEWAHTPPQTAGTLHYDFDLKLRADGEISGWLTQESTGYYAASLAGYYQDVPKERLRESARSLVQGFFRGADIVDVTRTSLEKWDGVYQFKTYFVVSGGAETKDQTLAFPQSDSLFLNLGAKKQRTTPYYLWPEVTKATARIELPEGVTAPELPRPLLVESEVLDIAAKWEIAGRECRADLAMKTKVSLVPPASFEALYNTLLSARTWLSRPLRLAAQSGAPVEAAPKTVTLEDFPMMPTAEGQLQLVDQRYPRGGNLALRREALRKVMEYYPKDKPTLFNAGVHLAVLDWDDGEDEKAIEQIRGQLRAYARDVTREDSAWAEYVLGLIFKSRQQRAEALEIFDRLSADRQVPELRRSWAFYQRGVLLESESLTRAIKALREGLALPTEARPTQFTLLAKFLILDGRIADLKKEIRSLLDGKHPQAQAMLTTLAQSSATFLPAEKSAERTELIRLLEQAGEAPELDAAFQTALQAAKETVRAAGVSDGIRAELKDYLAKHPPTALEGTAAAFKTRADFTTAIEKAAKEQQPEKCLRYGLELLTRFDPAAEFPGYLWQVTSHADWLERFRGSPEPLLPVLLGLCDRLPPAEDAYLDGRLLRARGLERRDDLPGAQQIYEELLRQTKLAPGYKVVAHGRLAALLEKRRDYARALEIYRTMEAEIEFGSAKDALLRAAFLNLEMAQPTEALRILDLLAGQKEALLQASFGTQLVTMSTLARDHAQAEAYWQTNAKWWPAWLALEKELGMEPLADQQIVPVITNVQAFGQETGEAAKQSRAAYFAKLRTIAHAARWEPGMKMELAGLLLFHTVAYAPEQGRSLRQFVITMHEQQVADGPKLSREVQLQIVIAAVDIGQQAKAIEVLDAYEKQSPPDDALTHAMGRLRAITALMQNKDLEKAATVLEKVLTSPNMGNDRALTVTILADVYQRLGRSADEGKLLKEAQENPQIKALPEQLQTVTTRLEKWSQTGEKAEALGAAVARWLEKNKFAWFDFVEPRNLEDPRLANFDWVLANPGRIFSPAEVIKFQLLVASAPAQSLEIRQQAFMSAVDQLVDASVTQEESRRIVDFLVEDAGAPEWVRVEMAWRSFFNAYLEGRKADLEQASTSPLAEKFNEPTRVSLRLLQQALTVDRSSPEALLAHCEKLLQAELTGVGVQELNRSFVALLELGQVAQAEKIYGRLGQAPFASDVLPRAQAIQMEFLKLLNQAKKWSPAAAEMRQVVLARFSPDSIAEPEVVKTLHNPRAISFLDAETATQARLYQIKTQRFAPWDIQFWADFARDLPVTPENRKLIHQLIEAALRHASGDSEHGRVAFFAESMLDKDDAAEAAGLAALFLPYRDAVKFPMTYAQIRLGEILQSWREGRAAPNFVEELERVQQPLGSKFASYVKLESLIQTGKVAELRKVLEATSPDELLSERSVDQTLRAYELVGMTDELELARETARKALRRAVADSWVTLARDDVSQAFGLAEVLREPALLPQEWVASLTAHFRHLRTSLFIRSQDSALRGDWPAVLAAAEESTQKYPTFYSSYWLKGAALYHLGRGPEAIEALKIYTLHSRNETEWKAADELLQKLQTASSVPP